MIKNVFLILAKIFGKYRVLGILKSMALLSRNLTQFMHEVQLKFEWFIPPVPEWHNHFNDQFYQFRKDRNPLWTERGVFNLLAMKDQAKVLELCCGDGFNAYHFYSVRASSIISVDFDQNAITHAKRYNQVHNVEYRLCDIRSEMPEGKFDNVIWDAAIEHFTQDEIDNVLKSIKERMTNEAILSGYTLKENEAGKGLIYHEYEFKSKEDLLRFFTPYFKNVKVFETIYPWRHNFYFYASDGILPFDTSWEKQIRSN